MTSEATNTVTRFSDSDRYSLALLLGRYGLVPELVGSNMEIHGSYWGDEEAGLVGNKLVLRKDTPVHSVLHEACHYICMDEKRRVGLDTDAGGDYDEENAVCYLQILLAEELPGFGREQMLSDMDAWGYTFRLGSARAWFEEDAGDARAWLLSAGIISTSGKPTFKIRKKNQTMANKNKTDPPLLTTARLRLRGINKTDSGDLYAIYSDVKTLEYWGQDPVQSPAEAWKKIKENLKWVEGGTAILWGIALRDNNRLIGTCTIFKINKQNKNGEAGYILNRAYWGKGMMTEAMGSVFDYAFNDLGFHRLEADTDPKNIASLALLEKFGFQREGYFRERWFVHGKWHDSVMLGLLRSDYL